jgi:hypothetical protein
MFDTLIKLRADHGPVKQLSLLLVATVLVTGCSSTIHKIAAVDGIQTLSIDAKQRLVIVNDDGGPKTLGSPGRRIACAEPSPDALVAQAAALSANLTTPKAVNAAIGAANTEAAASIGLRTQTIQILRDGYYRICEAYMNGSIGKDDYKKVLLGVDEFITVVAAIETIGGTVVPPAVSITAGKPTTAANPQGATADAPAPEVNVQEVIQAEGTVSRYQAAAIAKVVDSYFRHKRAQAKNKR